MKTHNEKPFDSKDVAHAANFGGRDILFISKTIRKLKEYFKENRNDKVVPRKIMQLVAKRKKLLNSLMIKDASLHKYIIELLSKGDEGDSIL